MVDSQVLLPISSWTHRCLRINELVEHIAEHATNRLALALTCRAFLEPVLNSIWKEIDDEEDLFKCFPEDAWEEDSHAGITLTRPLQPPDWDRFCYYARKIRHFVVHDFRQNADTFRMLSLYRPQGRHLLPNLRSLAWHNLEIDVFPYIHMFLNPRLRDLYLDIPEVDQAAGNVVLLSIHHICHDLRSLSIQPGDPGQDDTGPISMLVCGLGSLRQLDAPRAKLDWPALRHLLVLPHLTKLGVLLADPDTRLVAKIEDEDVCLPQVRELDLEMYRCSPLVSTICRRMQSCSLSRITFELRSHATTVDVRALFDALASCRSRHSITEVRFRLNYNKAGLLTFSERDYVLDGPALGGLATLSNLTTVALYSPFLDLDDSFLHVLSKSCLSLKSLKLVHNRQLLSRRSLRPRITFDGIYALAASCQLLVMVRLPLDPSSGAATDFRRGRPEAQNMSLRTLHLTNSPIPSSRFHKTAAYLSALFPKLRAVKYSVTGLERSASAEEKGDWAEEERARRKSWAEVDELRHAFTLVRTQEKKYWISKCRSGSVNEQAKSLSD